MSARSPGARGGAPARRPSFGLQALWAILFLALAGSLQLLQPVPWDADTAYHLAVARITREHGVLRDAFPWTSFSWLAEEYADKELLFHWILLPVAPLDLATAGRIAGTLLGAGVLFTLFRLLVLEGLARPGSWTILAVVGSGAFAHRLSLVRPHLLAIPLSLVVAWAASRRRLAWLGLASFLFPLCYVGWPLALVLVALIEGARAIAGRALEWRPLAVAAGGTALGLAVHPNFPGNLAFAWLQIHDILVQTAWAGAEGFELGGEFSPFSASGLLRYVLVPAGLVLATLPRAWRERRSDPAALGLALGAALMLALTLRTQRFIEYLAPFAVLAAAVSFRGRVGDRRLAALCVGSLAFTAWLGSAPVLRLTMRTNLFPEPVAMRLRELVPPGAQVFTCGWRLTGEMMLALPDRKFMVALDPVLFYRRDPALYRLWFETVHAAPERPASLIRERFGARYVLCEERSAWKPFFYNLSRDPEARLVHWGGHVLLFRIAAAPG